MGLQRETGEPVDTQGSAQPTGHNSGPFNPPPAAPLGANPGGGAAGEA
jgi:hypothetical protein